MICQIKFLLKKKNAVDTELLELKTGEITRNTSLISLTEIISGSQTIDDALLIISIYLLGIIWGRECFYVFDQHSKDEKGDIAVSGTAI